MGDDLEETLITPGLPGNAPQLLTVDDVESNREILRRRFSLRGFEIHEAASGTQALDLIEQQPFDLVLLDIVMPDVDGLEVLARIRSRFGPGELPVIMLTGRAETSDVVKALSLGANDYLTKPIDFAVAHARITAQLARKRAEEERARLVSEIADAKRRIEDVVGSVGDRLNEQIRKLARTALDPVQRALLDELRDATDELGQSVSLSWAATFREAA